MTMTGFKIKQKVLFLFTNFPFEYRFVVYEHPFRSLSTSIKHHDRSRNQRSTQVLHNLRLKLLSSPKRKIWLPQYQQLIRSEIIVHTLLSIRIRTLATHMVVQVTTVTLTHLLSHKPWPKTKISSVISYPFRN